MTRKRLAQLRKRSALAVLAITLGISAVGAVTITPQDRLRSDITATLGRIDAFGKRFQGDGFIKPFCRYVSKGLDLSLISLCNGVQVTFDPATRWLDQFQFNSPTCDSSRYVCNPSCDDLKYFCGRYQSRETAAETRLRALTRSLSGQRKRIENKKLGFEKRLTALADRKALLNSKISDASQLCTAQQTGYLTYCRAAASLTKTLAKLETQISLYEELTAIALDGLGRVDNKIYSVIGDQQAPHGFAVDNVAYIHSASANVCASAAYVCAAQPTPSPTPTPSPPPTCAFGSEPTISINTAPTAPNKFSMLIKNNDSPSLCSGKNTLFSLSVASPQGFSAKVYGGYNNTQAVLLAPGTSTTLELVITPPSTSQPASRVFSINAADQDNAAPAHSTASAAVDLFVGGNPTPTPTASPSPTPTPPIDCILGGSPSLSVAENTLFPGKFKLTIKNNDPLICAGMTTQFHVSVMSPDGWAAAISGPNVDSMLYVTLNPQQEKTVDLIVSGPYGAPQELRTFNIIAADYDGVQPDHTFVMQPFDLMTGDSPTPDPTPDPVISPTPDPNSSPTASPTPPAAQCAGANPTITLTDSSAPAFFVDKVYDVIITNNDSATDPNCPSSGTTFAINAAAEFFNSFKVQVVDAAGIPQISMNCSMFSVCPAVNVTIPPGGTGLVRLAISGTGNNSTLVVTASDVDGVSPSHPDFNQRFLITTFNMPPTPLGNWTSTPAISPTPTPSPTASPAPTPPSCLTPDAPVLSVAQDPNNPLLYSLTVENSDYLADANCPSVSTTFSIYVDPVDGIIGSITGANVDPTGQTVTLAPGESKSVDLVFTSLVGPLPPELRQFTITAIDMDGHIPYHSLFSDLFDILTGG